MNRQQAKSMPIPKLSHEQVVGYLLDYQFGRLPPHMNAAVEAHIRQCRICQKQGLSQASTEKRANERRARRLRPKPARRLFSRRGRNFLLLLGFVAIIQIVVISLTGGSASPLLAIFASARQAPAATPSLTTPTPTPAQLAPALSFDASSASAVALAISADGKTIATAGPQSGGFAVTLWNASTGKSVASMPWTGDSQPVTLSWSPDSTMLAAADGGVIAAWTVSSRTQLWMLTLPQVPAMRVYDVQAGSVVQRPDPSPSFANGTLLKWGNGGQLTSVPASDAGPTGVPAVGSGLVSLWQTSGSHMFADGAHSARVGISTADAGAHEALLSWSPDSHYLLWTSTSQQLALPPAASQSSSAASATSTVGTAPTSGVPVPNQVVGALASAVATNGHGDALVWFAPDGHELAACDRSNTAGPLRVYDVASGRILAELVGVCTHMQLTSLAWLPTGATLVLATGGKPVATYPIAPASS